MTANTAFFAKPRLNDQPLYEVADGRDRILFRSLLPDTDIDFLFDWVNMPYSRKFWQMDGSISNLYALLRDWVDVPDRHSFIGICNNKPVCQVDLYGLSGDELKDHVEHHPDDCGLHLLMSPPRQSSKGLSLIMLRHFLRFYFSFPPAERLFAEPDCENAVANLLAVKTGFQFLKKIKLSYKTANLYSITKEQFYATHSIA